MIGQHCIWDAYQCDAGKLSYVPFVEKALYAMVKELGLHPVSASFKQFEPVGVTGFILLEESHISIHTWPEHNFAAFDVFSCNAFDEEVVKKLIMELFKAEDVQCQTWKRGDRTSVKAKV